MTLGSRGQACLATGRYNRCHDRGHANLIADGVCNSAAEQLLHLVYDELRRLAAAKLARENPGHTLRTIELE